MNLVQTTFDDIHSLMYDIGFVLTLILVHHFLSYAIDGKENSSLFDSKTLKLSLYSIIGVILFHLIIKKIFSYHHQISYSSNKQPDNFKPDYDSDTYIPSSPKNLIQSGKIKSKKNHKTVDKKKKQE